MIIIIGRTRQLHVFIITLIAALCGRSRPALARDDACRLILGNGITLAAGALAFKMRR